MGANYPYDKSLYQFERPQPSYWEETAGEKKFTAHALAADGSCDVAVIGGGYTGLSAALYLARDFGVDVRVLEAGHIGWGASGRNGGFCSIGGSKLEPGEMMARYGADEARRYYRSQAEAVKLVREIAAQENIDLQACGDGEYTVAHHPAAFEKLREQARLYREALGLDAQIVSREAFLENGYESGEQFGALLLKPTFGLHPMRYILGLAAAVTRHGGVLHEHTEVIRWDKRDGRHVLSSAGASLKANRVIVACNGFMPEHLHKSLRARTIPVQSAIVVTRPLTENELNAQQWRTDCPAINSRRLFFYFRMLPDKRLLLGGRGDTLGRPKTARQVHDYLEKRIGQIWPAWRGVEITHRWRGLICFTREFRPAIGKFADDRSVFFGFGYHGNGVNTATWAGKQIAYWLAGSNSGDQLVPEHLPAAVRGMPKRVPLPALRRFYLHLAFITYRFQDSISGIKKGR